MMLENPYIKDLHEAIKTKNQAEIDRLEPLNLLFIRQSIDGFNNSVGEKKELMRKVEVAVIKKGLTREEKGELRKYYQDMIALNRELRDEMLPATVELKYQLRVALGMEKEEKKDGTPKVLSN